MLSRPRQGTSESSCSVFGFYKRRRRRKRRICFSFSPKDAGIGEREAAPARLLEECHCSEAHHTDGDTGYFLPKAVNTSRPLWLQVWPFPQQTMRRQGPGGASEEPHICLRRSAAS